MYMYTCTRTRARARARAGDGIPDTQRSGLPLAASVRVLSEIRRHLGRWRRHLLARRTALPRTDSPARTTLPGLFRSGARIHGNTSRHSLRALAVFRPPLLTLLVSSSSTPTRVAESGLSRCRATSASWTSGTDKGKRKKERTPSTFSRTGVALETSVCCQTRVAESGDKKN